MCVEENCFGPAHAFLLCYCVLFSSLLFSPHLISSHLFSSLFFSSLLFFFSSLFSSFLFSSLFACSFSFSFSFSFFICTVPRFPCLCHVQSLQQGRPNAPRVSSTVRPCPIPACRPPCTRVFLPAPVKKPWNSFNSREPNTSPFEGDLTVWSFHCLAHRRRQQFSRTCPAPKLSHQSPPRLDPSWIIHFKTAFNAYGSIGCMVFTSCLFRLSTPSSGHCAKSSNQRMRIQLWNAQCEKQFAMFQEC